MKGEIRRVCAALLKEDAILMVQHQHDGRSYWTLPGGGVEAGETPEDAAIREVREETGLQVTVVRELFRQERVGRLGDLEACFLVECEGQEEPKLGCDPELLGSTPMLVDLAWYPLEAVREDVQVSRVIAALEEETAR